MAERRSTPRHPAKPVRSALVGDAFADLKGRGARSNRESRFLQAVHEVDPEYLEHERNSADMHASAKVETLAEADPQELPQAARIKTHITIERARSIISRNDSPDIPFDQSVNPYRGCEHGCVYCYARPSHAYLGLSPGLDFETQLFAKENAAELLEKELLKPGYRPSMIQLGANTDPYQPIEREHRITRAVIEVLAKYKHPISITTKSSLVVRDVDLLREMAQDGLVHVWISVTSLDRDIARTLEPRAPTPERRIDAIRELSQAGIPVGVMVAPLIPSLTDPEMESILEAAARAGARNAAYTVVRLALEIRDLFVEWLQEFAPLRANHVMSLIRDMRGGKDYDSDFATRMSGTGVFATLLRRRFDLACRRLNLQGYRVKLDASRFRVPEEAGAQQRLF